VNPFVPELILTQEQAGRSAGAFEGAALFVDLSGFTALTEGLMTHGRTGAETLALALRFHFDPVVAAVHDAGGFITGFAGDACTALFPEGLGEGAAVRALAAAHRMQRFVTDNPLYDTPFGQFPFSIRVGLSYGSVRWGIVRVVRAPAPDPIGGPSSQRPLPNRSFYYFQGPPLDAAAAVEHRARADDVLFDGAFHRRCPEVEATRVEGDLWRAKPSAALADLHAPSRRLAPPRADALRAASAFLVPGAANIPALGEFRDVVSCFVAFDEVRDVPALIRLLDELAGGYGGTFTGLDFGDKGTNALIHFGAPVSHENDTERALDFALELARATQGTTRIRAGVTRDIRYVGWNGGTQRRELACLGRGTNLAARLMMKAAWGDLLCDPQVSADAASAYELEPRGDFVLKGFEHPIEVHAILAKRPAFEQPRSFAAKELVGREAEIHRLSSSLEPVLSGRFAGIIHVDGEAGLGKSYLVDTARRRLEQRGASLLWIHAPCDQTLQRSLNAFEVALAEYFQQLPASPREENITRFDAILGALATRVAPRDEALAAEILGARSIYAALLGLRHGAPFMMGPQAAPNPAPPLAAPTGGSLYDRLSPKDRFERTLAAIAAWLRAESRLRPVILHLEDAHWADPDTKRAVLAILRMGRTEKGKGPRLQPGLPIAIVCSARYLDDGSPLRFDLDDGIPVRNIALAPLSSDEIARIAEHVAGEAVPEALRASLIDGAGGNPFFAEEIFAYLREIDTPDAEPSISSPSINLLPSDVNSLLVARLDRLPPRVKLTVLAAAVLGTEFDLRVLTAMAAGDPEVAEHVKIAEAQRIFAKSSGHDARVLHRFRNVMLRNAAYEIQARARLQRLHQLAAEAIEKLFASDLERYHAVIARHYRRAGLPDKARPHYLAAAREAASRWAHEEAKRQYKSYLRLATTATPESVIARYELARDVYEPRGRLERAEQEHARVIEEALQIGDATSEALGRLGLGRVAWAARRLDEGRSHLTAALAVARRSHNRWAEALVLAHLALVHKAAGLREEASVTFAQALGIGRDLRMDETATVFGDMVAHHAETMRPEATLRLYEKAMTIPAAK
jgi:class 3 adenylate cyclase/tetratricopeptide (TPR) repeat protein